MIDRKIVVTYTASRNKWGRTKITVTTKTLDLNGKVVSRKTKRISPYISQDRLEIYMKIELDDFMSMSRLFMKEKI